tara:strand:- start:421 stop:744 length:324 start_codon:yes stop_codon:yes gene_type:complete
MKYYRKNCEYKYRYKLNRKDRIKIHLMMVKEVPIQTICKRYGLTKQFLKCKHKHLLGKTTPVALNGKTGSYYENEMDYGKLNLEYNFESLSQNEIKFYENNRKQNIS